MYGIFMESLVIFKLYTGLKPLFALSLLMWLFLLVTEKNKRVRIILVYAPVLTLALFLFPVSRKAFVAAGLDGETYYRVLWAIPMGVIFCYGACRLFAEHRGIGLLAAGALVVVCGSCVYQSPYITRAENLYHIPDTVVKICDRIGSGDAYISGALYGLLAGDGDCMKAVQFGNATSAVKNTIPGDMPTSNLEEIETIIKAHNTKGPQSEMAR